MKEAIIHLNRIKELRNEIKEKEIQLKESTQKIVDIVDPIINFLPQIGSVRFKGLPKPLKENVLRVIQFYLDADDLPEVYGFIELEKSQTTIESRGKIIKNLNQVLKHIKLKVVENQSMSNAINIEKV